MMIMMVIMVETHMCHYLSSIFIDLWWLTIVYDYDGDLRVDQRCSWCFYSFTFTCSSSSAFLDLFNNLSIAWIFIEHSGAAFFISDMALEGDRRHPASKSDGKIRYCNVLEVSSTNVSVQLRPCPPTHPQIPYGMHGIHPSKFKLVSACFCYILLPVLYPPFSVLIWMSQPPGLAGP